MIDDKARVGVAVDDRFASVDIAPAQVLLPRKMARYVSLVLIRMLGARPAEPQGRGFSAYQELRSCEPPAGARFFTEPFLFNVRYLIA